jgi:ribosomal protein S18 acetylase RimI-like enzyme
VIGFLLEQFPDTFDHAIERRTPIVLMLFILCLVISLRVFQTIITGVLDEVFTMPDLYEFFLVFVVVCVEYYLFSLFGNIPPVEDPPDKFKARYFLILFYQWGIALSFMAAIGYSIKLSQLKLRYKRRHKRRDDYYYTQLWLQRRNIWGMIALITIQVFLILSARGIFNFALGVNKHIPFIGLMIVILFANIKYSLQATFGESGQMSKPATQLIRLEGEKLEIKIVPAKKEDVAELRNLLMQHFSYVYKILFGNRKKSELLVSKMLESVLKARGGKHALGYKSFWIAHPKSRRREIVGMLMFKSSVERWHRFMTGLSITKLVFMNSGLRGLLQVWHNWRAIRSTYRKVGANELHIVYLAVSDNARQCQVGKQLLEHARQIAKDKGKNLITLCVRANNPRAKDFFVRQGFIEATPDNNTNDKTDNLLGQGAIIRMIDERIMDKP